MPATGLGDGGCVLLAVLGEILQDGAIRTFSRALRSLRDPSLTKTGPNKPEHVTGLTSPVSRSMPTYVWVNRKFSSALAL